MQMQQFRIKDKSLRVDYINNFLSEQEADDLFSKCEFLIPFNPNKRQSKTFGDEGLVYSISFKNGTVNRTAYKWPPFLFSVKEKLEEHNFNVYGEKLSFNICVVQVYPSGKYGINPHRDKEMTKGTKIYGLSLGQLRTLSIAKYNSPPILRQSLEHGSLYVFLPPTNDFYSHSIEKDESTGVRISLTFRNYAK